MRVELDIFSGRPNPTWELTAEESAEFLRMVEGLPKSTGGTVREDLGYRGLAVISGTRLTRAGFERLVVWNGVVSARRAGAEEQWRDKDRSLERWLLRSGKGRIDSTLLDEVGQELDRQD